MKLLLVEDDAKMARLLHRGLSEEGHQVDLVSDGALALEQGLAVPYDVVILDWALPSKDGVTILREWRARGLDTPVLMLTARGTVGEKVTSLQAGADDHLVKPFAFEELLARLAALHRRAGGHSTARQLGGVTFDQKRRALVGAGGEVPLTAREYALLEELLGHVGEVLSRTHLMSTVWGKDFDGAPNVVDVYVGYLRQKLERVGAEGVEIVAVRGIGYRLWVKS